MKSAHGRGLRRASHCGYNELILMRSRLFLFLSALVIAWAAFAASANPAALAQTPPKGDSQPPAPQSPTAQVPASAASAATSSTASSPSAPANSSAAGQAPAPAENPRADSETDESVTTLKKTVNEVRVVFTVTDKHGHYIKDLTRDDFRVIDDKKPAEVRSFRSETDLPLQVGLLIDASNSVRDRFKFEQEAAIEFLNQIVRSKYDRAFVIGFDTTPEVTQDFTDDTEALSHGVRMLRPGGGTAMYDAIYYACRDKLMQADKSQVATRRAIILLSDGEDNQSRVSRDEAVEMAQRAEVIIYTISTNTSGLKLRGDKILEHFADETGGKAFFPFKIQDVADAFSQIQDELRSQYAVSYKPADFAPNGKYRKIEIMADNKKYKVRARKGYYAPRQ